MRGFLERFGKWAEAQSDSNMRLKRKKDFFIIMRVICVIIKRESLVLYCSYPIET